MVTVMVAVELDELGDCHLPNQNMNKTDQQ